MNFSSRKIASPELRLKLEAWRSRLVLIFCLGAFALLIGRSFYLQGFDNDFLQAEGEARYARVVDMPALRGAVMDRNGKALAISTPVESIWAAPSAMKQLDNAQVAKLAAALAMDTKALSTRLADKEKNFVWIKRQMSPDQAALVIALKIPGVFQQREFRRFYPTGETAAHVIGFTSVEDQGQEGIELAQQASLAGSPGQRRVIKDRKGRIVEDIENLKIPREGKPLNLSIDERLQYIAHRELKAAVDANKAKGGALVMLDARTGEVLALVNQPDFNPNNRSGVQTQQMRNRSVTDTFEPGSTMKPFTMATALERGLVRPDSIVATAPGTLTIGNRTIRDAHAGGDMTMEEVVAQSSNVGTAKIAMRMNNEHLHKSYALAGFGTSPQTGFPGEVGGRLRNPATWREIEKVTMSYGYGLSVNLVQLARAYTVFASEGERKAATLMRTNGAVAGEPVFTAKTVAQIRKMLELAVESEKGTGQRARVVGYRVGGKTGTAKKSVNGKYADGKYVGSFVGIAPMSNPRIVVAVMIDEPDASPHKYYGGVVAAPAFSRIAREALRLLNVPFDAAPEPDLPRPVPTPEALPKEEV